MGFNGRDDTVDIRANLADGEGDYTEALRLQSPSLVVPIDLSLPTKPKSAKLKPQK